MTRRKVTLAALLNRQHLRKRTVRRYLQRQIAQEVAEKKKAAKRNSETASE